MELANGTRESRIEENDVLMGVQELVERLIGRIQIEDHLSDLALVQFVGGGHVLEGG